MSAHEHAYTELLLGAVPDLDDAAASMRPIAGSPPDLWALPAGCPFGPRCSQHVADCDEGEFPLMAAGSACRQQTRSSQAVLSDG